MHNLELSTNDKCKVTICCFGRLLKKTKVYSVVKILIICKLVVFATLSPLIKMLSAANFLHADQPSFIEDLGENTINNFMLLHTF